MKTWVLAVKNRIYTLYNYGTPSLTKLFELSRRLQKLQYNSHDDFISHDNFILHDGFISHDNFISHDDFGSHDDLSSHDDFSSSLTMTSSLKTTPILTTTSAKTLEAYLIFSYKMKKNLLSRGSYKVLLDRRFIDSTMTPCTGATTTNLLILRIYTHHLLN